MQNLIIKKSKEKLDKYPSVNFFAEKGECIIKGSSFMDDSVDFYEPLLDWIHQYFKEYEQKPLKFTLKLT